MEFPHSTECGLIEALDCVFELAFHHLFPHSTECGLIEASILCCIFASIAAFPHSTECGLIEAEDPNQLVEFFLNDFRIQLNAASLKQGYRTGLLRNDHDFRIQLNAASLKQHDRTDDRWRSR